MHARTQSLRGEICICLLAILDPSHLGPVPSRPAGSRDWHGKYEVMTLNLDIVNLELVVANYGIDLTILRIFEFATVAREQERHLLAHGIISHIKELLATV
mmetsp:Transcript_18716/g.58518  ORF Transcript_18716/g.58518 Transcript_18716/m.58518 type:complete len:101 (-) Transcript_18716:878-1180(-)